MYYVETKLVFRVEHEENASQLWWVQEAIDLKRLAAQCLKV